MEGALELATDQWTDWLDAFNQERGGEAVAARDLPLDPDDSLDDALLSRLDCRAERMKRPQCSLSNQRIDFD